jgi:hypothetical protein
METKLTELGQNMRKMMLEIIQAKETSSEPKKQITVDETQSKERVQLFLK